MSLLSGTNHFDINLEKPPFSLKPDEILVENMRVHQPTDHAKHLAVFKKGSLLANTDWPAMEMQIFGRHVSTPQMAVQVHGSPVIARGEDSAARANAPIRGTFDSTITGTSV